TGIDKPTDKVLHDADVASVDVGGLLAVIVSPVVRHHADCHIVGVTGSAVANLESENEVRIHAVAGPANTTSSHRVERRTVAIRTVEGETCSRVAEPPSRPLLHRGCAHTYQCDLRCEEPA